MKWRRESTTMKSRMQYDWIDYTSAYKELIDSWMDADARRFTGCDEGFHAYYQYWANEPATKLGENFWVKIVLADTDPFGIIAIALWDRVFTISEFMIRPDRRGEGLGSSALAELLAQSRNIIGVKVEDADAVIFPNNVASQKAFEKAGFIFHSEHPDGNAWYYRYHENTCFCGQD